VQLGAPGSEHEAREVFANLKRRYPAQLGPLQPTIVKAQSGGRTVYRVRVGEMSRDEATKLCQRLKSAGGSCFVAR
jgi:cell division septation protein DedD